MTGDSDVFTESCKLLACLLCLASCANPSAMRNNVSFSDVTSLRTATPDAVIAYGEGPEQFGELWLPARDGDNLLPLVILIHGGCWLNAFDIDHSRPMSQSLRDNGYAVWSLEYRRIGDPGGGWPGTFEDVARGIDHAKILAKKYPLDLDNPVFMGHSAGGHLALWSAARRNFTAENPFHADDPLVPRAVIGLAAIVDLEQYARGETSCERAARTLTGGKVERYRLASPVHLELSGEIRLIQGTRDTIVPPGHLRQTDLVPRDNIRHLKGAGHFDLIHPDSRAWQDVLETLDAVVR